ncbi:MAG: glucosamine-6-phosphate deaminase [Microcystaceae cyanobacterium]
MIPLQTFNVDALSVCVYNSQEELALAAAQKVQDYLPEVLSQKALAAVLLATGNSQIQFLDTLIASQSVDWSRLTLFHLDEFLGINADSAASFRYYLQSRLEKRIHPHQFHYIQGDALEPLAECDHYTQLLMAQAIDLCCLGIGKNGHLAFNEPNVANFDDPYRVKLVKLAQETRLSQVKQGHFPALEFVPQYAFTVTLPMLSSARKILCLAPGLSKAPIVKRILTDAISPTCPASSLRKHPNTILLLDRDSASLLISTGL